MQSSSPGDHQRPAAFPASCLSACRSVSSITDRGLLFNTTTQTGGRACTHSLHAQEYTHTTTCTRKERVTKDRHCPLVFSSKRNQTKINYPSPPGNHKHIQEGRKGKWGDRKAGFTGATALHAEDLGWGWVRRGKTLGRGGSEMKTGWKLSIGDGGWGLTVCISWSVVEEDDLTRSRCF